MKMIKDKKGFLLAEETLKIILAVIAIGFLAFLLFSLYNSGRESRNLEMAENSLNFLLQEMDLGKEEVQIFNPNGWWIASWPHEERRPNSCISRGWENCICIFPKSLTTLRPEGYSSDSDKGICKSISTRTIVSSIENQQTPIKISDPPLILRIEYGEINKLTRNNGS